MKAFFWVGWEHAQINDIDFLYNSASCGLLYHNKISPLLTLQSFALEGGGREGEAAAWDRAAADI